MPLLDVVYVMCESFAQPMSIVKLLSHCSDSKAKSDVTHWKGTVSCFQEVIAGPTS